MHSIQELPIFILTNPERFWLEQVYEWNKVGKRFSFKNVRAILEGLIPVDFTYQEIDPRLIEGNGCQITVLGILALDPTNSILREIDATAHAVRLLMLKDPDREQVDIRELATLSGVSTSNTSLAIELLSLLGRYHSRGSFKEDRMIYESIRIGGSDAIFENYMAYPGVEKLLLNRLNRQNRLAGAALSEQEIYSANQTLDLVIEKIEESFEGTQFQLAEIRNEINEMRGQFALSKKNWWQMLAGKLFEMTVSGIVSEGLSKDIVLGISNLVRRLGG